MKHPEIAEYPSFLLESIIPAQIAFSPLSFNSQNRFIWTSERREERVPKVVPFLVPFCSSFGPQNGPQNGSKIGPKIVNFRVHLWIPFFESLGLFGCLLGALLGLLRLSREASGPQKHSKNESFSRFLKM